MTSFEYSTKLTCYTNKPCFFHLNIALPNNNYEVKHALKGFHQRLDKKTRLIVLCAWAWPIDRRPLQKSSTRWVLTTLLVTTYALLCTLDCILLSSSLSTRVILVVFFFIFLNVGELFCFQTVWLWFKIYLEWSDDSFLISSCYFSQIWTTTIPFSWISFLAPFYLD